MIPVAQPAVVVIGGPNGAGKSTAAPELLQGTLRVDEFVNADTLAQGLSAFRPQDAAIEAGRLMLARLEQLERQRRRFAFEATLASAALANRLSRLKRAGFEVHLVILWLPTVDLALARVADRVRAGGHAVPADAVRRRFDRGVRNFISRYMPIADSWRFYDASLVAGPRLIASGGHARTPTVAQPEIWSTIVAGRTP